MTDDEKNLLKNMELLMTEKEKLFLAINTNGYQQAFESLKQNKKNSQKEKLIIREIHQSMFDFLNYLNGFEDYPLSKFLILQEMMNDLLKEVIGVANHKILNIKDQ
jgi:hypothetical protein